MNGKKQSFEDYYSSQENQEQTTESEEEEMENDEDNIYVTRSGRKSKPPERLYYDVQSCLIAINEHDQEEA